MHLVEPVYDPGPPIETGPTAAGRLTDPEKMPKVKNSPSSLHRTSMQVF
jgi:hypothetical protein